MKEGYKMKKKIISILLVVIAVFAVPNMVYSAEFDPSVRNSVVVVNICAEINGRVTYLGWGSGFFVGELNKDPMYIVTNYHVIEPFIDAGSGELITGEADGVAVAGRSMIRIHYSSSDYEEAYPVTYDKTKDIAILKISSPTSKRQAIALESPTDDMVGSSIYAVGFPGLAENIFTNPTSSWGSSDVSVTSGSISRMVTSSGTGNNLIQMDCIIRQGNSGGPVVNDDGEAIGVAVRFVSDEITANENVYYAVNIDEVIPFLKQYDIPYVLNTSTIFGIPTVVVLIIAGVVIMAMAAVIIILLNNKKKSLSKTAHNNTPIPNPGSAPTPMAAPIPQKVAILRSLAMQHGGMRISLQPGKQILIGTSRENCSVIFQQGTPGVSRRHCSISWDAVSGDFILTDLGSSYGTFLENKQRLAQGVPTRLRPGDRFYLGSPENLMTTGLE